MSKAPATEPGEPRSADAPPPRRGLWQSLLAYLGVRRAGRSLRVDDVATLRTFLSTRSSYVAQASLYGYLRTRAGVRFPELFDDDTFVVALNAAKWHVWLACLSDLSVYAGGLLARGGANARAVTTLLEREVERILHDTGEPAEADAEYAEHAQRVRARVALSDWAAIPDDESCFTESPTAVVRRAPIVEVLMELDEPIVRNSVRFRWQEVRRELRTGLDAGAVLASAQQDARTGAAAT